MLSGVLFLCVADKSTPLRTCWNLITELQNEYQNNTALTSKYLHKRMVIKTRVSNRQMFHNDPTNDKVQNVQAKIDTIKDIMIDNVGNTNTKY